MRDTTHPTPSTPRTLFLVWTVVAISITGLIAGVFAGGGGAREIVSGWDSVGGEGAAGRALVDGRVAAAVDDAVETYHPFGDVAVPLIAAARVALFYQGNPGVIVGRDRRLFTVEELAWHPDDDPRLERRLSYIRDVHSRLSGAGVQLIVLLVPSKARVEMSRVPSRLRASVDHPRLERARVALGRTGVRVVDGTDILRPDHFFARDTHWTPEGAGLVAGAIAPFVSMVLPADTEFELRERPEEESAGDLLSFTPVGVFGPALGLVPEIFHPLTAVASPSAQGGLFATPDIPVALVGTSYSADARWSFAAQLRARTGVDILEVAQEGVGPFVPMETYLLGETFTEIPPQLVVWEIPERYLTLPDTPMPDTPMPEGIAAGDA